MKKYILFLMFIPLLLVSCDKEKENGSIEPVSNVNATPFIGAVILNWTNPSTSDYYYTVISYKNADGEIVNKKVSYDSVDSTRTATTTISGLVEVKDYAFSLTAVSLSGEKSDPVSISATPQSTDNAKDYVLGTVSVAPASMGAVLSWKNISGVGVNLSFSYMDQNGDTKNLLVDASESGSTTISGGLIKTTDIKVYAQNISGGSKTEEKVLTAEPLLNPDDLIDPNVDYLTFKSSGTRLTISQPNVYNPLYEYKIVTTSADPYISMNGLKKAKAGTTLVFRYKTNTAFTLEVFWCDAGGGAAGGRSTRVNVPKNSSGDWETFSYDFSADMTTHKWAGKVGDFFRFDCGDNAGTTLEIRNIKFVAAE